MKIEFTDNHFATAHEALVEANKVLASNGLPLFTYGPRGGGGTGKRDSTNNLGGKDEQV